MKAISEYMAFCVSGALLSVKKKCHFNPKSLKESAGELLQLVCNLISLYHFFPSRQLLDLIIRVKIQYSFRRLSWIIRAHQTCSQCVRPLFVLFP